MLRAVGKFFRCTRCVGPHVHVEPQIVQAQQRHPHIKEWQKHCSCDSDEIHGWWQKWPDANIGLATGSASGFFVLDIDPRHGGKESMQELVKRNGGLEKTLASSTGGGGYHLFFNEIEMKIGNRANVLPGLDVRGDGGYIVAPPSLHKSGAYYAWLKGFHECQICDPPAWLINTILGKLPNKSFSFAGKGAIGEGGRNNFLTREAGKLRRNGLEHRDLAEQLRKINLSQCAPPLSDDEVLAIAASVARYPSATNAGDAEPAAAKYWSAEPAPLDFKEVQAPSLSEELLPERFRDWVMDISERMQVTPEFVMAPALVSFSSVVRSAFIRNNKMTGS